MATTTTTRKAAPKKGAAARAATTEKKAATKTIKEGGLTFKIPATEPGIILLHLGDLEGGKKLIAPVQDILRDTIGEAEYGRLMEHVRAEKLDGDATGDLIGGLARKILDAYGITEGE
jgi:hypothetical protein